MKEKIDIAACPDKDFVMPTGVMMFSVCINNPDVDIDFHIIIDESVTKDEQQDLMDSICMFEGKTVLFYYFKNRSGIQFPIICESHLTLAAYYRLYITDVLPSSINKVLYLDGDVIIRRSLKELWDMDLSGYALAAVPDMRVGTIDRYDVLGYSKSLGYFNSGVLLINLAYWRQHQVTKLFNEFIRNRSEAILYYDQDVLNYIFREQKMTLPIKYNFQHGFLWKNPQYDWSKYGEEVIEARKDPVIVHFTGNKPWRLSYDPNPFRSTFLKYQKMTRWKGFTIDLRPYPMKVRHFFGNILRRMRIRPRVQSRFVTIAPVD